MIQLPIEYEGKSHTLYYHDDLIHRIAKSSNTFFEEWLLTPLKQQVKNFNRVVDIGSNVGNHAYFFKNICNADRVICFEPLPYNFEILQLNCPNCELHSIGLSSKEETGYIDMINSLTDNSGTAKISTTSGISIELNTLDSYDLENVSFIKIDVAGHELDVIKGAINTITTYKPDILVETHLGISIEDVLTQVGDAK